ncbi:aldose epimerase family protein [Gemmobacter serpentinus]|uniref:aldose epimerase family protein n=1 Tax=Gemmobacter serpentinus TaxID=2652247 RepID=UPI00124E2210|nr:aldose epimerase family protein [Gemmobacter serpentinus]
MTAIEIFDHLPDGRAVRAIRLRGPRLAATILTLGATVQDLRLDGVAHPLVLGYPAIAPYLGPGRYVGALVGRFANRIAGARFTLDGREYPLDRNEFGRQMLHGGSDGIHQHLWQVTDLAADRVTMVLDLPDGHMGFPGNVVIRVTISVADAALSFEMQAQSDAATPFNLAHHGYFALDAGGDIRDQHLQIAADHYLPIDGNLIPTGQIAPVAGTDFDFRKTRRIGSTGYDHNFCLSSARQPLRPVARLVGQDGVAMLVETTECGIQVYDGRHFSGVAGLTGVEYGPYAGIALETQGWPDAPNQPAFPDCILRPGQDWRSQTRYVFSAPPA